MGRRRRVPDILYHAAGMSYSFTLQSEVAVVLRRNSLTSNGFGVGQAAQEQAAEEEARRKGLADALEQCQDMVDCLQAFSHDQVRRCAPPTATPPPHRRLRHRLLAHPQQTIAVIEQMRQPSPGQVASDAPQSNGPGVHAGCGAGARSGGGAGAAAGCHGCGGGGPRLAAIPDCCAGARR